MFIYKYTRPLQTIDFLDIIVWDRARARDFFCEIRSINSKRSIPSGCHRFYTNQLSFDVTLYDQNLREDPVVPEQVC